MENNNENRDLDINNATGEINNAEDYKNTDSGKQADAPLNAAEEKADAPQEEAAAEQKEASDNQAEKDQNASAESVKANNGEEVKRYSSSYEPPYYAPSFSVSTNQSTGSTPKTQPRRNTNIGLVVALCGVSVMLVFFMLISAMMFLGIGPFESGDPFGNINILMGNKDITIVDTEDREEYSVVEVASLVSESVVEITTTHVSTNPFYGQYVTSGAGSGVIFSQDGRVGYIVTNYHVIDGAENIGVRVKFGDKNKDYTATYIAGDDAEDIAVITIPLEANEELTVAAFRDLEKSPLLVGEGVVAIGNPLGQLGGTVTNGIISALDREIIIEDNTMTLLQTNAAVNPGNSGGGLFDMSGYLIGIVNAKESDAGIEGLGFAIPSDRVLELITDILEEGYITGRSTLGISVQYGTYGGYNGVTGVIVTNPTGEFNKYDCIVEINGQEIKTMSEYNAAIKKLTIGEIVSVKVIRDRAYVDITATVKENTSKY